MEWLSDEQQAAWRPFVALLLRLPTALDAQLQKDAGITQFDYLVLSGLSEAPDRTLRMSDLAATANSSLSRLSHVVSRLEAKGWVRREPCPGDGRFINAVLTDAGWQKVTETAPGHVATVRELLVSTLSEDEFAQLGAISAKVLAAQGIKVVIPTPNQLGDLSTEVMKYNEIAACNRSALIRPPRCHRHRRAWTHGDHRAAAAAAPRRSERQCGNT